MRDWAREFLRTLRFPPAWLETLPGDGASAFRRGLLAGLVVDVAALPLAIAIAGGPDPAAGLVHAGVAFAVLVAAGPLAA